MNRLKSIPLLVPPTFMSLFKVEERKIYKCYFLQKQFIRGFSLHCKIFIWVIAKYLLWNTHYLTFRQCCKINISNYMLGPFLPNSILFMVENQRLPNCQEAKNKVATGDKYFNSHMGENKRQWVRIGKRNLPGSKRKETYVFRN